MRVQAVYSGNSNAPISGWSIILSRYTGTMPFLIAQAACMPGLSVSLYSWAGLS